ncbi:MAG: hypothetical protein CMK50_00660 [Propionibacteriaceae bacterium]|nr:hypothetical protein [Propionibacteriaceae bacterium]
MPELGPPLLLEVSLVVTIVVNALRGVRSAVLKIVLRWQCWHIVRRVAALRHAQPLLRKVRGVILNRQLATDLRVERLHHLVTQLGIGGQVSNEGGGDTAVRLTVFMLRGAVVGLRDVVVGRVDAPHALAARMQRLIRPALLRPPDEIGADVLDPVVEGERHRNRVVGRKPLEALLVHGEALRLAVAVCILVLGLKDAMCATKVASLALLLRLASQRVRELFRHERRKLGRTGVRMCEADGQRVVHI